MTSQQFKQKFNEYETINSLLHDNHNDYNEKEK